MPRRQGSEDLLELNDLERGVTREDSEEAKWGYLAGAVRRQQILTGIVSAGMTYTENGMPIVPIDFEGLCVKIPVREMTLIEWPEDEPIPRSPNWADAWRYDRLYPSWCRFQRARCNRVP